MTEKQTFSIKAGYSVAQQIAQGMEVMGHYGAPTKRESKAVKP